MAEQLSAALPGRPYSPTGAAADTVCALLAAARAGPVRVTAQVVARRKVGKSLHFLDLADTLGPVGRGGTPAQPPLEVVVSDAFLDGSALELARGLRQGNVVTVEGSLVRPPPRRAPTPAGPARGRNRLAHRAGAGRAQAHGGRRNPGARCP
jgi:hypothetical protein